MASWCRFMVCLCFGRLICTPSLAFFCFKKGASFFERQWCRQRNLNNVSGAFAKSLKLFFYTDGCCQGNVTGDELIPHWVLGQGARWTEQESPFPTKPLSRKNLETQCRISLSINFCKIRHPKASAVSASAVIRRRSHVSLCQETAFRKPTRKKLLWKLIPH